MAYQATISSINMNTDVLKKDGSGSFKAVTLVYTSNGMEKVKNIAHFKLKQNPTLGAAIKSLKPNDVVWLSFNGFDLSAIDTANPTPNATFTPYNKNKPSGGFSKPASTFDQFGAQVGQSLNAAVQLICNGKVKYEDLKATAKHILAIGEELKEELKSGLKATVVAETPTAAPIDAPQFDEELNDEVPF